MKKSGHYVYLVKVDDEIKYVGKGTKNRFKHAVGGTSSVPEINKDFFEGKKIEVFKTREWASSEEAENAEKQCINSFFSEGFNLYNRIKYLGNRYNRVEMSVFNEQPCAKAINQKPVNVEEELRNRELSRLRRHLTPQELVRDITGMNVVVNIQGIEKLYDAEDIPHTLYLFDKGYEWFAHLRLDTEMSYAHAACMEEAVLNAFRANKEY